MNHTQSLPEPSTDALEHSQKLIDVIRKEIESNATDTDKGSVTFRRYMEMALYQPSLGYYVAGTHKIGAEGDFVTAPEISPLFSRCIATQLAQNGPNMGGCPFYHNILELGAGSGIMATDILIELEKQNKLPEHYYILDLSPDLIQRQKETLQKFVPHLIHLVKWLNQLPENFEGAIIGNEVLDAMPVDVFTQQNQNIFEHHVIWEEGKLCEQLRPASNALHEQVLALAIPHHATPYTSEINPNLPGWFETISKNIKSGIVLLIDYGHSHKEYYQNERKKGTLICHFQHLVNEAPLFYPGLQDITANVDFTAVAEAADDASFTVSGYTTQASFLSDCNLEGHFMDALTEKPDDQYKLAQQVRALSMPSEMGERFKVIALTKNCNEKLQGFSSHDLRHRL